MAQTVEFDAIRRGEVEPDLVWTLIASSLATDQRAVALKVYGALRSWTWKALDRRRRDAGLNRWAILLNNVEASLAERFPDISAKVVALVELTHESLDVAALSANAELLERKHVAEIVRYLASADAWTARTNLMHGIGLKAANATRLLGLMQDAGYVEQSRRGREVAYRLTTDGREHAATLERERTRMPCRSAIRMHGAFVEEARTVLASYRSGVHKPRHPAIGARPAETGADRPTWEDEFDGMERSLIAAIDVEDQTFRLDADADTELSDWERTPSFGAIQYAGTRVGL